MADPTPSQSRQWAAFQNKVDNRLLPKVSALKIAKMIGKEAAEVAERLTGRPVVVITPDDETVIDALGARSHHLARLVAKVQIKQYGVQFQNGKINIVGFEDNESTRADVFPTDNLEGFGFPTLIVIAGIAAITLLIGGDQATNRMEKQAEIEATRLRKRAMELNAMMAKQRPEVRDQWDKWTKQTHARAMESAKVNQADKSILDSLLGSGGKASMIGGLFALGALAIGLQAFKKG